MDLHRTEEQIFIAGEFKPMRGMIRKVRSFKDFIQTIDFPDTMDKKELIIAAYLCGRSHQHSEDVERKALRRQKKRAYENWLDRMVSKIFPWRKPVEYETIFNEACREANTTPIILPEDRRHSRAKVKK